MARVLAGVARARGWRLLADALDAGDVAHARVCGAALVDSRLTGGPDLQLGLAVFALARGDVPGVCRRLAGLGVWDPVVRLVAGGVEPVRAVEVAALLAA